MVMICVTLSQLRDGSGSLICKGEGLDLRATLGSKGVGSRGIGVVQIDCACVFLSPGGENEPKGCSVSVQTTRPVVRESGVRWESEEVDVLGNHSRW